MIPNPNPNIADGVKADNTTYSSNKIELLIKTATELPIPEAGDAGKVLTVDDELGYELATIPAELPTPAEGDAGKVLAVDDELGYELVDPVNPTDIIDDTAAATTTVYSSDKVDTLLSSKQDALTKGSLAADDDLDNFKTNGYYYSIAGVANRPVSAYGILEVVAVSETVILQRYTVTSGTGAGSLYQRLFTSSAWGNWITVYANS